MRDGRQLVGQMLAFDKHMNLVLADCEEFRRVKRKAKAAGAPGAASTSQQMVETEEKRMLGLAIIRGATVVSCAVDGPPPSDPAARLGTSAPSGAAGASTTVQAAPGISRPAGRGAGIGLQGPAAGVGGPGFPSFPGGPPGGFPGRGGPPRKFAMMACCLMILLTNCTAGFPPTGFPGGPPRKSTVSCQDFIASSLTLPAAGFAPPGFQPPPGGRGFGR